jgi:hypothetical protein
MEDWLFKLTVELEPTHPHFGEVHHKMIGIGYVHSPSIEEARLALAKYCAQYHFKILEEKKAGKTEKIGNHQR